MSKDPNEINEMSPTVATANAGWFNFFQYKPKLNAKRSKLPPAISHFNSKNHHSFLTLLPLSDGGVVVLKNAFDSRRTVINA
jgi:hypothetical protein